MNFGEKLKQLRQKENLTQAMLADKLYVSRTMITKYESGVLMPTDENLQKIADVFQVKTTDLIDSRVQDSNANILRRVNKILFGLDGISLMIATLFTSFMILPIFSISQRVYPTPTNANEPQFYNKLFSVLTSNIANGNVMGYIALATCGFSVLLSVLLLTTFKGRRASLLRAFNYLLVLVNVFVFTFAIIFAVAYTQGNIRG